MTAATVGSGFFIQRPAAADTNYTNLRELHEGWTAFAGRYRSKKNPTCRGTKSLSIMLGVKLQSFHRIRRCDLHWDC